MKSRNREFNETRNRNLAQTYSNLSNSSSYHPSFNQAKGLDNHSFTSSFIKKSKPDVCVSCVNKKIATDKKVKQIQQKEKTKQQINAEIQHLKSLKDPQAEYRQKLKKQAKEYNTSLMSSHRQSVKSQKLFDNKFIQQYSEKEQKQLQQEKQHLLREKQMELQYRKDLYLQYKQQETKKVQSKLEKLKPEKNELKLSIYDKSKMKKEYSTELKKQINYNTSKKHIQKQKQREEQRKILSESQKNFLKYTQFLKQEPSINPQVFEELKLIDFTKKTIKFQEREQKNQERLAELQREKELYKCETEKNLRLKNDYQRQLKTQMNQKNLKIAVEKEQDRSCEQRVYKYTEDIIKESRIIKPCEQCNHQYEEKCLI